MHAQPAGGPHGHGGFDCSRAQGSRWIFVAVTVRLDGVSPLTTLVKQESDIARRWNGWPPSRGRTVAAAAGLGRRPLPWGTPCQQAQLRSTVRSLLFCCTVGCWLLFIDHSCNLASIVFLASSTTPSTERRGESWPAHLVPVTLPALTTRRGSRCWCLHWLGGRVTLAPPARLDPRSRAARAAVVQRAR